MAPKVAETTPTIVPTSGVLAKVVAAGALKQRIQGSHTRTKDSTLHKGHPASSMCERCRGREESHGQGLPCHRHMVIATTLSADCFALLHRSGPGSNGYSATERPL